MGTIVRARREVWAPLRLYFFLLLSFVPFSFYANFSDAVSFAFPLTVGEPYYDQLCGQERVI